MDLVAGRVWADERRPIRHVDWVLLLLAAGLVLLGLFLLYSATNQTLRQDGLDPFERVKKQAFAAVIGMVLVLVIVALAGHGQVTASVAVAALVGLVETAGRYFFPQLGAFLIYLLLIPLMVWRPDGLLVRTRPA